MIVPDEYMHAAPPFGGPVRTYATFVPFDALRSFS